ncbi:MAG: hypothetical protein KC931_17455, partial [Candidatus Omnitrophica bacterium]|nr:hypothetical protein [Candidatus Omnitrophota bacterium]
VDSVCERVGVPHATTIPIFDKETYMDRHSLGYDPHCNTTGHQLMAQRLFCFLLDQGAIPQQVVSRLDTHAHYTESYDPTVTANLEQQAEDAPQVIDIPEGEGALGLIGGIDPEGKMARYAILRLSGEGDRVDVDLKALMATSDQPQWISAEVEGMSVGSPVSVPKAPVKVSFPIPEGYQGQTVEVKLIAHGPVWTPPLEDRFRGATPQTVQLIRIKRVSGEARTQS